MKNQWDQFGAAYETFSSWISDKEKQLEALKSAALPLERQINTVKVLRVFSHPTPQQTVSISVNLDGQLLKWSK